MTIKDTLGFTFGALLATAGTGAVVRGLNRFPKPMRTRRRKKKR